MSVVQAMLQEMNASGIPDSVHAETLQVSREYLGKVRRGTKPGLNLLEDLTPIYLEYKRERGEPEELPASTSEGYVQTARTRTPRVESNGPKRARTKAPVEHEVDSGDLGVLIEKHPKAAIIIGLGAAGLFVWGMFKSMPKGL